jgi:hypothetical protein
MDETTTRSIGEKFGWPHGDEPMTDFSDLMEPSDAYVLAHQNHIPARTVGATAKDRERARLHAGRRPRKDTTRPRSRARGTGRRPKAQSTRSSAKSGDSGSEDGEPPPARECAWCGEPIDHLNADARHCSAKHRVYAQRERDRREPERVAARAAENGTAGRAKHCACWPQHDLVDRGVCVKCGRARGVVAVAWITEARDVRSKQLVARAPARRNPRYGDRKRKPVTERKAVAA